MSRKKTKQRYCGIGGQAVLDGIMMRNGADFAIAVRKPDGTIALEKKTDKKKKKNRLSEIPFIRGVVNFIDSLVVGFTSLNFSAEVGMEDDEEEPGRFELFLKKHFGDRANDIIMTCTVIAAVILAVAVFILLPYGLSALLSQLIRSKMILSIFEGVLRLAIFIAYVALIGLMDDIDRMYMYHGAEHKCINCIERGKPLTVPNVRRSSRLHPRCGTSFMLYVMVISCVLFFFIQVSNPLLKLVYRLLLIPVIAAVSYELIRLAGRSSNPIVKLLNLPGLGMQKLSTREPEDSMIEVAIQAVEAVFDWRAYQEATFGPQEAQEEDGEDSEYDYDYDDDDAYDDVYDEDEEYYEEGDGVYNGDDEYYEEDDGVYNGDDEYSEEDDACDDVYDDQAYGLEPEKAREASKDSEKIRSEEEAGREIEELLENDL
ncbi:MAG: DUF1385 domain-containing protein [Lachnospiraceae bacterium]|nr:DUF1385 domain-containing protein [Lachnospiraceae bacterium]